MKKSRSAPKTNHSKSKKYSRKSGQPPGSLVYTGSEPQATNINVIQYNDDEFVEKKNVTSVTVKKLIGAEKVNWIAVSGFRDTETIEKIGGDFGIHPLLLEDIFNVEHLPKVEDMEDYLFITLKSLIWDVQKKQIDAEQISLLLGKDFLLTFSENNTPLFEPVIERLSTTKTRARSRKEDYLSYLLLDKIVDNYYVLLDQFEDQTDELEDLLLDKPTDEIAQRILALKKQLVVLRRTIYPLKEEIRGIVRDELPLINSFTRQYLNDIYDHLIDIIQTIDNFREMIAAMMDLLMANNANRTNSIMKTLTIISSIFIPLTFLAGVYGMNFRNMPELGWQYGYFILLGLFIIIAGGMYFYMKKKKWF
jgi:magnesium transporter